jgi:hypothetical protein
MNPHQWRTLGSAVAVVAVFGCNAPRPTSPDTASFSAGQAGANGETLKIGAPAPESPTGNIQLTTSTVVLTYSSVSGTYSAFVPSYQIELRNPTGAVVANPTVSTPTCTISASLAPNTVYTWRVRATYQGASGPWSSAATFRTQISSR